MGQHTKKRMAEARAAVEQAQALRDQISVYADRPPVNGEDGYDDFSEERGRIDEEIDPALERCKVILDSDDDEVTEELLEELEHELSEAQRTLGDITPNSLLSR